MAENEDLDLDAKKSSGNKKNIIMYVVIGLLLIGVSVTSTMLLLGGKGEGGAAQGEGQEEVAKGEALYLPLETMVVNFGGDSPARFLQVDVQVMTREKAVKEAIKTHMPVIRNDLLLLLSNQKYEQVSTLKGKEKLREQVLETIRKDLTEQGEPDAVEAVYFTSFVMQ